MAFLAAVTSSPAALLGLNSGRIAEDAPADLIIFNPNAPWVCDSDILLSRSKNTPLDGRRMTGRNPYYVLNAHIIRPHWRLPIGVYPFWPIDSPRNRTRRHSQNWLRQYRGDKCSAHRPQRYCAYHPPFGCW